MAQQSINIGTTANDGTGETVRSAFDKTNDNFTKGNRRAQGSLDISPAGRARDTAYCPHAPVTLLGGS